MIFLFEKQFNRYLKIENSSKKFESRRTDIKKKHKFLFIFQEENKKKRKEKKRKLEIFFNNKNRIINLIREFRVRNSKLFRNYSRKRRNVE